MRERRLDRLRAVAGTGPVRYAALLALVATLVMGATLAAGMVGTFELE